MDPRDVGAIDIGDKFALVEVPERTADDIVRVLRGTTMRGKKVVVRRDKDGE
jgi:ATP-dependent RNA helicase DeaD